MKENTEVNGYLNNSPKELMEILTHLRALIFEAVPQAEEHYKWNRPVYSLDKDFCYLQRNKDYVNFGFINFGLISDEKELLQGTGKTMRHIKIETVDQIDKSYFVKMLRELTCE